MLTYKNINRCPMGNYGFSFLQVYINTFYPSKDYLLYLLTQNQPLTCCLLITFSFLHFSLMSLLLGIFLIVFAGSFKQYIVSFSSICSRFHRTIWYPKLEVTNKDHWVQPLSPHRSTKNQIMSESVVQALLEFWQDQCCDRFLGEAVPVPNLSLHE